MTLFPVRSAIGKQSELAQSVLAPHIFLMLPDEQATPEQLAIFKKMTGQERLSLAQQLYWSARKMKTAGVRAQHPDWTDEQVEAEVVRIFTHART